MYTKTICLSFILSLATLSAQTLQDIKAIRHDTADLRGQLIAQEFTLKFVSPNGTENAVLDTTCQQSHQKLTNEFCTVLPGGFHQHAPLPPLNTQLIFRRRTDAFEVLTPHKILLHAPAFTSLKGKLIGTACLQDVKYQRLEPIQFGDDFMRTEEEAKQWGMWDVISGQWKIASVMERIHENPDARIREGKEPVADRSPNPFTLASFAAGNETDSRIIITGYPFWNDCTVAVTAKPVTPGGEFGLVFAYQDVKNYWKLLWGLNSYGTHAAPLRLLHVVNGEENAVATAYAIGRSNNWSRLSVTMLHDRIIAAVEGQPVITYKTNECTGGKTGLCAVGAPTVYFDDFSVTSSTAITIDTLDAAHFLAPAHDTWVLKDDGTTISFTPHNNASPLMFGHAGWKTQRAEATFTPSSKPAGLTFGDGLAVTTAIANGKLMLTFSQKGTVLRTDALPLTADAPVTLAIDTTEHTIVSAYLNNRLALRQRVKDVSTGGSIGLTGTPKGAFSHLHFFANTKRDWERPVDIERFANDPYMQGWASSRYVWLRTEAKDKYPQRFNYTGDLYGAFSLTTPIQNGLDYTFGHDEVIETTPYTLTTTVDEVAATAVVTLSYGKAVVASAKLANLKKIIIPGEQIVDEKIGERPRTPDTETWGKLVFHHDGYLFWADFNDQTIFYAISPAPDARMGRSFAVNVPKPLDFIHIDLRREHLKDYLFEKAECDWAALGRWEVTNRFACDPRWSHMNGESFGVASLWSKFTLAGDYTLECFAGMRMRQGDLLQKAKMSYPRVGDINVALDGDGTELFSGYNFIIQAWDQQWSEKTTQFRRLDDIVATSDLEYIPRGRKRAASTRAVEVDWDPGGRPVHGAWYALKIRKTGHRFDVYFDNQKVFTYTDDKPLEDNRHLALWTQFNSIVLARVKVNYTQINPPQIVTDKPDTFAESLAGKTATAPESSLLKELPANLKADFLKKEQTTQSFLRGPWNTDQSAEDITINSNLRWHLFRNANSGGDFGIKIGLPPPEADQDPPAFNFISFDFVTSPGAQLNLYLNPHDHTRYFVPLTGPAHNAPNLVSLGKPVITPLPQSNAIAGQTAYHAVIPVGTARNRRNPWTKSTFHTAVIGMLHEGYLNAGLKGNHAGEWFAIANLKMLDMTHNALQQPQQGAANDPVNPLPMFRIVNPVDNGFWPLNAIVLQYVTPFDGFYPDLSSCKLEANGQSMTINETNTTCNDDTITIVPTFKPFETNEIQFKFIWSDNAHGEPQTLVWKATIDKAHDVTPPLPPVIDTIFTLFTNPARWEKDVKHQDGDRSNTFTFFRRDDGTPAIRVSNTICGSHNIIYLNTDKLGTSQQVPYLFMDVQIPADSPVDYQQTVSQITSNIGLTDCEAANDHYLGAHEAFKADNSWQTLRFDIEKNYAATPKNASYYRRTRKINSLGLGNWFHSGTQPGAEYAISNVRFAETVSTAVKPLWLDWHSYDLGGIAGYAYKWSANPVDEPDTNTIVTDAHASFATVPNGLQFFHIKAMDNNGNWSATAHQPFYLDNAKPTVIAVTPASDALASSDSLTATFSEDCFGLSLQNAKLTVNDRKCTINDYTTSYDEATHVFSWNMLLAPGILNGPIADKSHFTATLSGLHNAAGTPIADCIWNWIVDYSLDKKEPAAPSVTLAINNLLRNTIHYNTVARSYYPNAQSALLQTVTDEITHSPCLDVTNPDKRRFYTVTNRGSVTEDQFRLLRFRYRLFPGTKTNLLIHANGKWFTILMNGPEENTVIGSLPNITDDNQWYWVTLDVTKDILDKIPNLPKREITNLAFGQFGKLSTSMHMRLDDISFIPCTPALLVPTFSSADATGISAFNFGLTQDEQDCLTPHDGRRLFNRTTPHILDKEGLWYLNTNCSDGAGNISETVRYPLFCRHPAISANKDLTLDNYTKYAWTALPLPGGNRKTAPYLYRLDSPSQTSKVLMVSFYANRKTSGYIVTPAKKFPVANYVKQFKADFLLTSRSPISVTAVALDAINNVIARSNSITINSTDAWKRNAVFTFDSPAAPENIANFGFTLGNTQETTGYLVIDNIMP